MLIITVGHLRGHLELRSALNLKGGSRKLELDLIPLVIWEMGDAGQLALPPFRIPV